MIELIHLTKSFKKPVRKPGIIGMFTSLFSRKYTVTTAVNDISFKINDGEIVGYIGANGAGKSTTIKMMCGILNPTSGKVLLNGVEPYKKRREIAKSVGVVFGQKTQLWWDIPLIESFVVLKEMYQISDQDYEERMEFLKSTLGISEFLHQPVRTLSLGQRMRADLAAAWLHNPSILFLDEPTIGLDVLVKEKIRQAIKTMNNKYHTTVILTTHDMEDIENLCSRIILIEKGGIIYDGSLKDIKHKFGDAKTISVPYFGDYDITSLDDFNQKVKYELKDEHLLIKFNAGQVPLENIVNYVFHHLHTQDFVISDINIEDIVKEILAKEENHEKI